ncbi:GDSL-type esterase/lipase family protein [Georgenia sp. TF02-10]|uniref:GDSL-type esterase/lipase family protein n=1 Tax=Georgenia sp. TF02-10 TaxID=2917725 RepID=UPI001FA6BC03|nr:GDSL-type esterase/lipase family protein [Georgenia sp. TF02-10]UNX54001.1 GDSL-type esterase/lipase family protein [Georgenia sp. TF02-10]
MGEGQLRICVVGDELTAGVGDARALGWVGRVMARTRTEEPAFVAQLAVPAESTTALAARWESETHRRFASHADNRLVVGLGATDLDEGLSLARSRLNLANILDGASASRVPSFVVGPPPRPDVDPGALAALSVAFADVCQRRHVPYVETYEPLRTHEQWHADVAAGDGRHPGQAGYGLLAWLVLHNGWHDWLGLPADV